MTMLDELKPGEVAQIVAVEGKDAISTRLLEMGLIEGTEISCIGKAPLGDPLEFEVCGYRISLRSSEARRVQITR